MRNVKKPDSGYASFDERLTYVFGGHKPPNLHKWGPGVRDIYALHYIVSGKGILETNGSRFLLQAGESFMIYPQREVYYYPDRQDPWEYVWVEFRGNEVLSLLSMIDISAERPVVPKAPSKLEPYFFTAWHGDMQPYEKLRSSAQVQLLLTLYMEYFPKAKMISAPDYASIAKEYIQNNYWKPELTVADIVAVVNIERSYLFRLFKERTGMSVSGYLTVCRIDNACKLLQSTDLSIKTVSCSVGYRDQLYFSKVFKKTTSYTPSDYKSKDV
ncbi:AraC family transcriptional regulator [Paenibacillus sp. CAU 1782]